MELIDLIERNVRNFMQPIQAAGYTDLPYEKATGSLESQLRSYLFFACEELTLDRVESVWYGGGLETSAFSLKLISDMKSKKIEFIFNGTFDPKYELPANLNGLHVKIDSSEAYYPYCRDKAFPKPNEAYQALQQLPRIKPNRSIRIVKNWLGKGKKLQS